MVAAAVDAFRCARRIRLLMREHDCDIVHSHGLKPHALSAIIGVFGRACTIVHMHDIPYSRAERIVWRLIGMCTTRMILVSRPCYPGRRLPRNTEVIPNGIIPYKQELDEKALQVPIRLGFVGRFHENKGMDLLLDWVRAIRDAGLDVTLALRGRPDPESPEYWEHIQRRIHDEGLFSVVRHDGWLSRANLYENLDVLLVPSHIPDPGPLVVPEAMSAGVIVIGYPAGGIPFSIQDGISGLLIENAADVGIALKKLVETPGAYARMRHDAHGRVLTTFGLDTFHRRIAALYRDALGTAPRPAAAQARVENQES
jgi:glycosyltransferase involved in cell wall biosynthesis